MNIVNTTPHEIRFRNDDGTEFTVPPCGTVINARVVEHEVGRLPSVVRFHDKGIMLVGVRFESDPASEEALARLEHEHPEAIIVGSVIAAQAFPGHVFGLTPAAGFERVPVAEKRMNPKKFTMFLK